MKHRQKTPTEIKAELTMRNLLAKESAEGVLDAGKRLRYERNVQIGHNVATGIDLLQLLLYYDMTDEEVIEFEKRHEEIYDKYESGNEEDIQEVTDMFKMLKERIGYDVIEGKII